MILAINAGIPARTLKEFVDYVKAAPGKYSYASAGLRLDRPPGLGAVPEERPGSTCCTSPTRAARPPVADLMGGQVEMYFGNAAELLPYANNDRVRLIAVSAAQPHEAASRRGGGGRDHPRLRDDRLERAPGAGQDAAGDHRCARQGDAGRRQGPGVIAKLATFGIDATGTTSAEFVEMIRKEQVVYGEAIEAAGVSKQ